MACLLLCDRSSIPYYIWLCQKVLHDYVLRFSYRAVFFFGMAYRAVFSALKQRNGNVWGIVWPLNVAPRIFFVFSFVFGVSLIFFNKCIF